MPKFFRTFVVSLSVILLVLACCALVIDPYGVFRTARVEGLNKYKPSALPLMRLVKPYHVNWLEYDVLVTGSSRAGRGIDCRYFIERGERCYNAALTGGGIYEAYRFLQQQPPDLARVLVFLDFFVFLQAENAHEGFVEERLWRAVDGSLNGAYPGQFVNDSFGLLFSRQTLASGHKTWKWQDRPYMNHRADGMLYLDDWGGWYFDATTLDPGKPNLRVNRQVLRYEHILDTMKSFYEEQATDRAIARRNVRRQLGVYRELLELLYRWDAQASLVVPPSHASYWMLLRDQGFYARFEQWKRELVRINEDVARRYARPALPLFDFSGPNSVALSAPPRRNKPATFNTQFTDVMHFSRAVGERMLDRIMGTCENSDGALFGYCISSANIDAQLQRQATLFEVHEADYRGYLRRVLPADGDARSQQ